jgi:hypothetical protein
MQSASLSIPQTPDAPPAPCIESDVPSVGRPLSPCRFVGNVCHDLSPDETWDYFQAQGIAAAARMEGLGA